MPLDFFKQFRIRDRGPFWLQLASVGILIVAVCWFCVRTIHWPIVGDASLMHYIAFLGDHGVMPYKTVSDVNWPAAYLPDWLVMHTLGLSAMAWRLYDFAVLGVTGWAIVQIARPVCWRAGLWAALLFALIHGRDGLQQAGQRDLTIAMLLSLGVCVLLRGKPKTADYFLFGVSVGLAGMIKPVALPFLLVAVPTLRRECRTNKSSPVLPVLVGMGGFGMPILGTVVWLLRYGALGAFIREQLIFTPFHASLERKSPGYLLQHGLSPVLPLVVLWLVLLIVKTWSHREKEEDGEPQAQRLSWDWLLTWSRARAIRISATACWHFSLCSSRSIWMP